VSARKKLNAANLLGALVIAGLVGMVTNSGAAFLTAFFALVLASVMVRDIR